MGSEIFSIWGAGGNSQSWIARNVRHLKLSCNFLHYKCPYLIVECFFILCIYSHSRECRSRKDLMRRRKKEYWRMMEAVVFSNHKNNNNIMSSFLPPTILQCLRKFQTTRRFIPHGWASLCCSWRYSWRYNWF